MIFYTCIRHSWDDHLPDVSSTYAGAIQIEGKRVTWHKTEFKTEIGVIYVIAGEISVPYNLVPRVPYSTPLFEKLHPSTELGEAVKLRIRNDNPGVN